MAITLLASGTSTSNAFSTGTITWTSGALPIVACSASCSGGNITGITVSGGGATWTVLDAGGQNFAVYGSRRGVQPIASNTTPTNGALTITVVTTGSFQECIWAVFEATGTSLSFDVAQQAATITGTETALNTPALGTINAGDMAFFCAGFEDGADNLQVASGSSLARYIGGGSNTRALICGTSTTDTTPGITWNTAGNSAGIVGFIVNGADTGSSTDTALSVENATITLTAQDIGTHFAIVQVEGTLSLTGQDVSLLAGQGIAVDNGTLLLSGQDVSLLANQNFTLPVTNTALTVEGQDLPFLLTIPWTEGELSLTGQDVTLIAGVSSTLAVDNATLTLTGSTITLHAGEDFSLSVDNGTITLTGQSVTLTALTSLTLQIESATLVLSANEVQLITPYVTGTGGARDCRKRAGIRLINYGR